MAATTTSSSKTSSTTDGASRASLKGGGVPARASLAKGGAGPADPNAPRASLLKGGATADAPPETPAGPTPEELEAARIAAEEAARLELQAAPIREYLETTVVPLLLKGLQILAVERPENPVDYLAQYLIMKNPQPVPPPMEEVVVEEVVTEEIPWAELEAELLPSPAAQTRAASVKPVVADAQPPGPATRAASVNPTTTAPAPPAAATRAASVEPAADAAATRAASLRPAVDAPATRAASVKPALANDAPPAAAVLGPAATRAASVKPPAGASAVATRAASVKPAAV